MSHCPVFCYKSKRFHFALTSSDPFLYLSLYFLFARQSSLFCLHLIRPLASWNSTTLGMGAVDHFATDKRISPGFNKWSYSAQQKGLWLILKLRFTCKRYVQLIASVYALRYSGLRDLGYLVFVVDEPCFTGRNSSGYLVENNKTWPRGLKAFGDYLHARWENDDIRCTIKTLLTRDKKNWHLLNTRRTANWKCQTLSVTTQQNLMVLIRHNGWDKDSFYWFSNVSTINAFLSWICFVETKLTWTILKLWGYVAKAVEKGEVCVICTGIALMTRWVLESEFFIIAIFLAIN